MTTHTRTGRFINGRFVVHRPSKWQIKQALEMQAPHDQQGTFGRFDRGDAPQGLQTEMDRQGIGLFDFEGSESAGTEVPRSNTEDQAVTENISLKR